MPAKREQNQVHMSTSSNIITRKDKNAFIGFSCYASLRLLRMLAEVEQFSQACKSAAMLQEVMLKEFKGRGSASNVDAKTDGQKGLQLLAELLGLLEAWSTVGCDQVECLERLLVEVGRLRLNHLDRHDTEGPDINLGAILLLLHNLRGHPVGGANHGSTLRFVRGELSAKSEIGYDWLAANARNREKR